jgi:hypothetical protein
MRRLVMSFAVVAAPAMYVRDALAKEADVMIHRGGK